MIDDAELKFDDPCIKTDAGRRFARKQLYLLRQLGLARARAIQLMQLTGPTWAVATFRCYLLNRKKFNGREQLLQYLMVLHTEGMKEPNEFFERMRVMSLIPVDPAGANDPLEFLDCDRILNALRFFAQRY